MNIVLIGYGRMGRTVERVAKESGHEIVTRIESAGDWDLEAAARADVAIEFSVPEAVLGNICRASELGLDIAVGTTGWFSHLDEVKSMVEDAGSGLIYAPNFSVGVHLFFSVVREAARLVNDLEDYDLYVQEMHHRHKKDRPSGTAARLADIILEEVTRKKRWSGHLDPGSIPHDLLQVDSVRAGENPGEHKVGIEGLEERIEIRHESLGRGGFARGAVMAAQWIHGRKGVYTMAELFEDRFPEVGPF